MVEEVWKTVVGYEGYYEVSDQGRVRSLDRTIELPTARYTCSTRVSGKVLRPFTEDDGYALVVLSKDNKQVTRRVHRLVLEAFIGPCPDGEEACHNVNDPTDSRLTNLRWDTHLNNIRDRDGLEREPKRPKEIEKVKPVIIYRLIRNGAVVPQDI